MQNRPKHPFGLTLAGIWTGGLAAIMSAFFGLSLIGSYAPADFAVAPMTTSERTMIVANLVAGLLGIVIGFLMLRRRQWGYWLGLLFHVFIILDVLVNAIDFVALSSQELKTISLVGSVVVSVLSLLTVMYLISRRGEFFPKQIRA